MSSPNNFFRSCCLRHDPIGLTTYQPPHDKTNKMACAPSEDSDQPGHPPSLIKVFPVPAWSYVQADMSLHCAHMPFWSFCHEVAHIYIISSVLVKTSSWDPKHRILDKSMWKHVSPHIFFPCKASGTHWAGIRSLSCMYSIMYLKSRMRCTQFLTYVTSLGATTWGFSRLRCSHWYFWLVKDNMREAWNGKKSMLEKK